MPRQAACESAGGVIPSIGALSSLAVMAFVATNPAFAEPPKIVKSQDQTHWAFRPLAQPAVPAVKISTTATTLVDEFVLARLDAAGLAFAPPADRATLIRRVSFDLIGLPPSPDEVAAFVGDERSNAFELLLDRLLASPQFGERWGRHWLDNAGYTDIYGGDNDAAIIKVSENRWMYRDWVVAAINADKPFDQFLIEQLAGDELVDWRKAQTFTPEIQNSLIATGFLRGAADDTNENELNTIDIRYGVLHRTIEGVANNLLGLTLQCAKCHRHKYEPISHEDYYRFQAVFQPVLNPDHWLQPSQRQLPNLPPVVKAKFDQENAQLDKEIAELKQQAAAVRKGAETRVLNTKLTAIPEPIRADVQAAVATAAEKRTEVQKYLAGKFEASLKVSPDEVNQAMTVDEKKASAESEKQAAERAGRKRTWQHWQVAYDASAPTPTKVLKRGNPLTPGDEVGAGLLEVLGPPESTPETAPPEQTSGRRLALGKRLTTTTSPAGALVIRVRVNRIWQHLFGRGIVATSENFGVTGDDPTHPELLEWLAADFVAQGQKLKPFLKSVMLSSAYWQSSAVGNPAAAKVDPDNLLLWRQRLRRLESEAVRDAMLSVSGKLDLTIGGAPIPVEPKPDGSFVVKTEGLPTPTSQNRRTLYLLARRNYHPTLLTVFDQPNLTTTCMQRETSAVVLQSLTLLNDSFVLEQADAFAARVAATAKSPPEQIGTAFSLALGRSPTVAERAVCLEAMNKEIEFHTHSDKPVPADEAARRALGRLCHTLLNTSEFLYIP